MTVYTDNPAGRLHQLLSAFRTAEGNEQRLARALKVPPNDHDGLMRAFAQVFSLPNDIKVEIREIDGDNYDSDLAMRWQNDLNDAIGTTLFWGEKDPDSPTFSEFLTSLEYCSYVLHRHRRYRIPPSPELENLKKMISELLSQLQDDSSIDKDLRAFLLRHTEAMDRALSDLSVRGVAPLEEAFDRAFGALNLRPDLTARTDDNPGVWKKFAEILLVVAAVLQISTSSFVLPGQVRQAIEGTQPAQVEVVQQRSPTATPPAANSRPNDAGGHSREKSTKDGKSSPP